jgi:hypothetical protein
MNVGRASEFGFTDFLNGRLEMNSKNLL